MPLTEILAIIGNEYFHIKCNLVYFLLGTSYKLAIIIQDTVSAIQTTGGKKGSLLTSILKEKILRHAPDDRLMILFKKQ